MSDTGIGIAADLLPLLFGERIVGLLLLAFGHRESLSGEQEQLLVALAQQMTLAIVFKRLAMAARNTAVLEEAPELGLGAPTIAFSASTYFVATK